MRSINEAAADALKQWAETWGRDANGAMLINLMEAVDNFDQDIVDAAYMICEEYGNASAATAAAMYDATAEFQGKVVPAAEPADNPPYWEVEKTVRGTLKSSQNIDELAGAVSRLVKRTGVDTTLKNAIRDGAEWAWVPSGDTCSFCLMLASRGWQKASKKALKNGHAEHIHSNCDCTYTVRFDGEMQVEGYDPDALYEQYQSADGSNWREKMNSMRREHYARNKDQINVQKRAAYARKKSYLLQEDLSAKPPKEYEHNYMDFDELSISAEERELFRTLNRNAKDEQVEYGVIIDNGIPREVVTSKEKSRVYLPDSEVKENHTDLLHSHTGNTPPSATDLRRLTNAKIDRVGVVTYNGDIFIVDARQGWRPTTEEFDEDERSIREAVDAEMMEEAFRNGWSPDELTYMCIREEFYRLSRKYEWKMEGGLL